MPRNLCSFCEALIFLLGIVSIGGCTPTMDLPSGTPIPKLIPTKTPLPQSKTTIQPSVLKNLFLVNPGIGWQADSEQGNSSDLPETVSYANRHLISWKILNPGPGLFDWNALDLALMQAKSQGKQFSFRVYSMAGEGFDGQQIPDWVLAEGAALTPSGEVDYSNCNYQQQWGEFVNALVERYDGNPNIAYIDISGYGNFNEWSWQDQTLWDDTWDDAFSAGKPDVAAFQTLDGQARRRLADMFIGGSSEQHACHDKSGRVHSVAYSYNGFRKTQLVMPFAGIRQSTQYVRWRRPDVGFRNDCLGKTSDEWNLINEARGIWKYAPVIFEFCAPDQFSLASAQTVLQQTHGSLVHDNGNSPNSLELQQLLLDVGYRYILKSAEINQVVRPGDEFPISMDWQNIGSAPSYPKMGQNFTLHLLLMRSNSNGIVIDQTLPANISSWMPVEDPATNPPDNYLKWTLHIPAALQPGVYALDTAIMDMRTGLPIQLAIQGGDSQHRYMIGYITVVR